MTVIQRCIVVIGVLALLVAGLYPHFIHEARWTFLVSADRIEHAVVYTSGGYHFAFSPRGDSITYNDPYADIVAASHTEYIDRNRLLLEWLLILLVTGGLTIAAKPKKA